MPSVSALAAIASATIAGISVRNQKVQNRHFERFAHAQERIAQTYEKEVAALKREVKALRREHGKPKKTDAERLALDQQREARLQRKTEQDNLKMLGKAVKWASENL